MFVYATEVVGSADALPFSIIAGSKSVIHKFYNIKFLDSVIWPISGSMIKPIVLLPLLVH